MANYTPSSYNFYSGQYGNPTAVNQVSQPSSQFDVKSSLTPYDFGADETQNTDFRNRFSGWLGGLETPEATRQRFENRYGYQDLADNYFKTSGMVANMGNAIQAAPGQIQQRTAGANVTQGQLANIQNKEVGELVKNYTALGSLNAAQGQQLAMVESNLNDAAQLEMSQQQKMMTPWLQEYDSNAIMQARKFSGWTFASQLELNRLLANQQAGLTWSNAEADRANQLAMQEASFQNSLEMMNQQENLPSTLASMFQTWSSGVNNLANANNTNAGY